MIVDLTVAQWDSVELGQLTSPDGTTYARRSTRLRRKAAAELLAEGAPLVLYYFGGRQLDWIDGADAQRQWQVLRPAVTTDRVASPPARRGGVTWTAGRWESADGATLVVLTGSC